MLVKRPSAKKYTSNLISGLGDLFGEPELPAGFRYIPDVISTADEKSLVQRFEKLPLKPFEFHGHQLFAPWPGAGQLAAQHRTDGRSALLRDLAYVSPWPNLLERLAFRDCGCQIGEVIRQSVRGDGAVASARNRNLTARFRAVIRRLRTWAR